MVSMIRIHPQSFVLNVALIKKSSEEKFHYARLLTTFTPFLVVNEVNNENKITTELLPLRSPLLAYALLLWEEKDGWCEKRKNIPAYNADEGKRSKRC